ncbi:Hcy-binding domain-containing protein [Mycena indigotica]|uniref:Hcy-binding domain-containing protein n=1 Tax=Mycena indigotica TaxID=2126181 RepID=A0A8H6WKQ1_9AGAR|nr:Hcy-binding domain-containing protein [Mycena indigotica]KAF7315969.1 Hcy-binding domain-containing protein [Mycena indigotica]
MTAEINESLLPDTTFAILDGGLGTTLETTFGLDISHTPLWSAKAAIEHPEVVIAAHEAFLQAGSDIILTSTYQCSSESFRSAGYNDNETIQLMLKCVGLAIDARIRFSSSLITSQSPKIALSLGPYGASLSPAQEFNGFYPPPFGPRGYSPEGLNVNAFAPEAIRDERLATQSLADYHSSRLQIFKSDTSIWESIDLIAFESVPLLREVSTIRLAMGLRSSQPKPWWISLIFPEGQFPNTVHADTDKRVSVKDIVSANFSNPSLSLSHRNQLHSRRKALHHNRGNGDRIARGDVYDPATQTWKLKAGTQHDWIVQLQAVVARLDVAHVWAGVVVGGCCRTGPEDIQLIKRCFADHITTA